MRCAKNTASVIILAILLSWCFLFCLTACHVGKSDASAQKSEYDAVGSSDVTSNEVSAEISAETSDGTSAETSADDSEGQGEISQDEYFTVTFYKEDGLTEYLSVTVKANETFAFPSDHPSDSTKRREFLGWGIYNGESFEETIYDITASGADIVTTDLKFKALYGGYQYTPISP